MKLKQAIFKDVLSHVDSRVDLGDTLTVFTGVSDSGKSGCMRGLLQVCRNEPAGIDLLRHGAKRGSCSEVEITGVDDAGTPFSIVRRRGKSKNEYEIDGKPILAFGQEVPVEVKSLLRLSPHAFQIQSDGSFMLSATDGAVAKIMSSTVGLAEIDAAFSEIRSRKTANDTALSCAEADYERERDAAAAYDGIEASAAAVTALEAAVAALNRAEADTEASRQLVTALEQIRPSQAKTLGCAVSAVNAALEKMSLLGIAAAQVTASVAARNELVVLPDNASRLRIAAISAMNAWKTAAAAVEEAEQLQWAAETYVETLSAVLGRHDGEVAAAANVIEAALSADVKRSRMDAELSSLLVAAETAEALADSGTAELVAATAAVAAAVSAEQASTVAVAALNERSTAEAELLVLDHNVFVCAGNIRFVEEEIAEYRRTHPVCPECGSEQKHWHVNQK